MRTVTVADAVLERIHPRDVEAGRTSVYQREGLFFRSYVQINLWCSEHCRGAWFREKNTSTYVFEDGSDAMMFKITWG